MSLPNASHTDTLRIPADERVEIVPDTMNDQGLSQMNAPPPSYDSIYSDSDSLPATTPSSTSQSEAVPPLPPRPGPTYPSEKSSSIPPDLTQPFPIRGPRNTSTTIPASSESSGALTRSKPVPRSATSSSLPLRIPTKKYVLSSGFPYQFSLVNLGISPTNWARFSDEIAQATKLSVTQQSLAWTSGIGVGLVSTAAVPPFGAAAGVFAGKAVYDESILNNVRQGLEQGKLGEVLKRWNEDCWRELGLVAKLVVKQNPNRADHDESQTEQAGKKGKEKKKKDQPKTAGRFELVLESFDAVINSTDNSVEDVGMENTIEVEGSSPNAEPVELDSSDPPEIPRRSPDRPAYIPELASEKAAAVETVLLSTTSAHPLNLHHPSQTHLVTDTEKIQERRDDESPVSGSSPSSDSVHELDVSSIANVVRRGSQDTVMDASLTPAPLFAR